jgi:hypothetical protein
MGKAYKTSYSLWALLVGLPGMIILLGDPPRSYVNKRNPSIVYPWQSYGFAGISLIGAAWIGYRGWRQNMETKQIKN